MALSVIHMFLFNMYDKLDMFLFNMYHKLILVMLPITILITESLCWVLAGLVANL